MNRSTIITITIIVAIVIVAGWFTYSATQSPQAKMAHNAAGSSLITDEDTAPYTDLAGEPVDLSQYAGSVMVVNSWASWCPSCVNELPNLATLANEFASKEVVVIALNRKESKEQAERFLRGLPELSNVTILLDPDDHFYTSIDGYAMPETVFYDGDGNVVSHHHGAMTLETMRAKLKESLAASGQGTPPSN